MVELIIKKNIMVELHDNKKEAYPFALHTYLTWQSQTQAINIKAYHIVELNYAIMDTWNFNARAKLQCAIYPHDFHLIHKIYSRRGKDCKPEH